MPVAPSFQSMPIVKEIYFKNGKNYVDVKNEKTGTIRSVRWYSDIEYAKAYGKKLIDTTKKYGGLKHARGFDNGYILVIRNNRQEDEEWLKKSIARYAVGTGWYIVSTEKFPDDAPKHLKYLILRWEEFRQDDDEHMKEPAEIAKILNQKARKGEWIKING